MNRYQSIVGRINYALFIAVAVLLPYPQICLRYAVVLWFISWLLEGRWLSISNLKSQLSNWKHILPILLFGLWFALKVLSGLWAQDGDRWAWQMERYMTFGLMVPIALWGVNECYDWCKAGRAFVISCTVAVPIYILWMTILYFHPEWVDIRQLNSAYPFAEVKGWWEFVAEYISAFKHRLFFCSVELFGAIVAWFIYRKRLTVLIPALVMTLSAIPLTTSRQSILTCAALLAVGLISSLPRRYRWSYGVGIFLIGLVMGGGILSLNPRMQGYNFKAITEVRAVSSDHDVRLNIWGFALQHPEDYIAKGVGAGQSEQYLNKQFTLYFIKHGFHAHNQYLEELIEVGIPGLLLFLLAWLSIPLCAPNGARVMAWMFTVLFLMNMFTDCMFGKFDGIALWLVGVLLILFQSHPQRKEQTSRNT